MARCFIAGEVTKHTVSQYKAVSDVLTNMGLIAVCTADIQRDKRTAYYKQCMLRLMDCDMLCVIGGSENNPLTALEKAYAGTLRMPILHAYQESGEWYIK